MTPHSCGRLRHKSGPLRYLEKAELNVKLADSITVGTFVHDETERGAEQRGSLCVRESCECTRRSGKCAAHAAVPEARGRLDEGGSTSGTPAGPSNGTPWRSLAGKAHVCGVCV